MPSKLKWPNGEDSTISLARLDLFKLISQKKPPGAETNQIHLLPTAMQEVETNAPRWPKMR
jgi:hypothetical protein